MAELLSGITAGLGLLTFLLVLRMAWSPTNVIEDRNNVCIETCTQLELTHWALVDSNSCDCW